MRLDVDFQTPVQTQSPAPCGSSGPPLVLELNGFPVPSFKNRKIIAGKRLITNPKQKKLMQRMEEHFVLQLLSAFRTDAAATSTGRSRAAWIRSSTPADDCWTQIPQISVSGELCSKGKEGATITIERIA